MRRKTELYGQSNINEEEGTITKILPGLRKNKTKTKKQACKVIHSKFSDSSIFTGSLDFKWMKFPLFHHKFIFSNLLKYFFQIVFIKKSWFKTCFSSTKKWDLFQSSLEVRGNYCFDLSWSSRKRLSTLGFGHFITFIWQILSKSIRLDGKSINHFLQVSPLMCSGRLTLGFGWPTEQSLKSALAVWLLFCWKVTRVSFQILPEAGSS